MKTSFQDYFKKLIGEAEAEQFFCAIKGRRIKRSLRINTLKNSKDELIKWLESQGYTVQTNTYCEGGIELEGKGQEWALKLPYHSGYDYPQDSASMFAVELLDPQPGETVIDLTAAPGGKTTHIAQKMQNTGVLVANDMDTRRLKALHSNLERLGVWNAIVTRYAPHKLAELYPETFDRILLDPSCSGEGLLVTPDGKSTFWSEKSLKRYAGEQFGLLVSAFKLLKPGGRLVFSTCTLNIIENEGVVERLLEKFPQAKVVDRKLKTPPQVELPLPFHGTRFWPQKTQTKGFFCIAITKTESLNPETTRSAKQQIKTVEKHPGLQFLSDYFDATLPDALWTLRDECLFPISRELAAFSVPPFYSLPFPFLKIYSEDYRPTHSGALYIGMSAKKHVYELSREELQKVFERQPIANNTGEQGLYLARYQNFPLGVAKLTQRGVEVVLPRQF